MRCIRLVVTQNTAMFRREETCINKMTYPLAPYSTIIGALHNICGYRSYHPMDLSIQGTYEMLNRRAYTDKSVLNYTFDDRGYLAKTVNGELYSNAYTVAAVPTAKMGTSFRKGVKMQVADKKIYQEYLDLRDQNDRLADFKKNRLDPVLEQIRKRKKRLSEKRKGIPSDDPFCHKIKRREEELKKAETHLKEWFKTLRNETYVIPFSHFCSLLPSARHYEELNGVKMIIHIHSEESVLRDIMNHLCDLMYIGRSEDSVSIEDASWVTLSEKNPGKEIRSPYSGYISCDLVREGRVFLREANGEISGTRYRLPKNYEVMDGKRIFERKDVLYLSDYAASEFGNGLYHDEYQGQSLIVHFL